MEKCDSLILGKIVTLDTDAPVVEAIATKDGKVVYIGDRQTAEKLCDENTKVLDYSGKYIYPGFFDSHTHGSIAGQRILFQCDLTPGKSMEEYVEILKKYIEANPGRDKYMGAGWVNRGPVSKKMLDDVCKDVPIVLTSVDGHSMWINSKALEECGYDAAKAKEMGTDVIHVDENGEPNGLIGEAAMMLAMKKYPATLKDIKEGLLVWQEFAFKNGITACVEATGDSYPETLEAYRQLTEEGKWKLRTYAYDFHKELTGDVDAYVAKIKEEISKYQNEYFKVIGSKLFFDGVVEAHTAYLAEPYSDDPNYYGVFNFKGNEENAKEIIKRLNAENIPVHIHTIGDGAVKFAMDCIEQSEIANCNFKVKNCLAHLELVKPEDIKRISEYGVIAIVAPLWVPIAKAYFTSEIEYLGEERAYNTYPIKSFEDAGATICFHTDYPITTIVSYPNAFYIAKKRRDPFKGIQTVKNPDEGISQHRSLLAITANAAYMVNEQDNLGKLLPGMIANCVVYDTDLLDEDIEKVPNAKLVATIIDGQEVYHG